VTTRNPPRRPARTQSLLRWSRYAFLIVGILALGYCAFVLLDTQLYQAYEAWRFEKARKDVGQLPQPAVVVGADRVYLQKHSVAGPEGSAVGRIEISTLGLAAMILEGIDPRTLRRAVGHIPGTALPGEQGNVAIAGHRDTFFRSLRDIRKDAEITLTTLHGSYRYRVESTRVVEPEAIDVLADTGDAVLTLVTCYPFDFIGPAPKRFIVRAHKIPG